MGKKIFALGIGLLSIIAIISYVHAASVTLAWVKPADGGPVEGYKLYWSTVNGSYSDDNSMTVVGEDSTSETVYDLDENETYYFIVRAYNDGGANLSPASNEIEWAYSDNTAPSAPDGVAVE